jgi:hypothetical protein
MGSREQEVQKIFNALADAGWLNNATATGSIEILNLIRAALAQPDTLRERLEGCMKCGSTDIYARWHKGHEDSIFKWDNDGCRKEDTATKGIDSYTEHIWKLCRGCGYNWRAALLASAPTAYDKWRNPKTSDDSAPAPAVTPRKHQINPNTGHCVMCGRNDFTRSLKPECDYEQPAPPVEARVPGEDAWLDELEAATCYGASDKLRTILRAHAAFIRQAAEQAAMERAAQLVESVGGVVNDSSNVEDLIWSRRMHNIAERIRNLASPAAAAQREPNASKV